MPDDNIAYEGALIPFAIRAVQAGWSANRWLGALRESGAGMRRSVGLSLYGKARALAAEYGQEPLRDLNAVPTFSESKQWPTRDSHGVIQTVQLVYREKVTGRLITRHYNVKTPNGITRGEAIDRAIAANDANAGIYEQTLVGAFHTGTAVLVSDSGD